MRPFPIISSLVLLAFMAGAPRSLAATGDTPAKPSAIPFDQIGATAEKQYSGDGLSVVATDSGARLRCVFQKMEGEATREGLWLASTAEESRGERFRVVALQVGRVALRAPGTSGTQLHTLDQATSPDARGATHPGTVLPVAGEVEVAGKVVRFIRPGLIEKTR